VCVYLTGNNTEHDEVLSSFAEGLFLCGDIEFTNKHIKLLDDYNEPNEVAVVFGKGKYAVQDSRRRQRVIDGQRQARKKIIIIEKGYINRDDYYSVGFNDINGWADFRNTEITDPTRTTELKIDIKPWRKKGEYILLIGQVPWDASVQDSDHQQWLEDTVEDLQTMFNFPIVFRPHPLAPEAIKSLEGVRSSNSSLKEDFEKAYAVVTFNSTTAVESVIEGIPTFVADRGSMAWDVGNIDMALLDDPFCPDRTEWLNRLSYAQWTKEEMRTGLPWLHLMGDKNA